MLAALIGPISQLAGTWLEGKVEKTKAETGAKVAKAKAEAVIMEKKATGEIDWDLEAIKGSQNSWKDEWLNFVFNPTYTCVHSGMEEVVANGFAQLETMPQWYQYSLGLSLLPHLAFVVLLNSLERSDGYKSKRRFHGQEENPSSGTTQEEPQQTR